MFSNNSCYKIEFHKDRHSFRVFACVLVAGMPGGGGERGEGGGRRGGCVVEEKGVVVLAVESLLLLTCEGAFRDNVLSNRLAVNFPPPPLCCRLDLLDFLEIYSKTISGVRLILSGV